MFYCEDGVLVVKVFLNLFNGVQKLKVFLSVRCFQMGIVFLEALLLSAELEVAEAVFVP